MVWSDLDLMRFALLILLIFCFALVKSQSQVFRINSERIIGRNTQFWKASGTDLLFYLAEKSSGQALLDRMEQTNSCIYLRNHYALTHYVREGVEVGIQVYSEDASGNPEYDFSRLNRIYGEFVKRGLKPVVECDYMPKALTHNEADPQALKKAAELTVTKSYSGNSAEGELKLHLVLPRHSMVLIKINKFQTQ